MISTVRSRALALAGLALLAATSAFACQDKARELIARNEPRAALEECRRAAKNGDTEAALQYGTMLNSGVGTTRDSKAAFPWIEKAAQAGNSTAQQLLAELYMEGLAVRKDFGKARAWARKSAAAGNPMGSLQLYRATIFSPELSYIENGKPNEARYRVLAARPAAERTLDIEGYTALATAAQRLPIARLSLGAYLLDTPGESNREAALKMLSDFPNLPAGLANIMRAAEEMSKLGRTHVSVKLYFDARRSTIAAAAAKASLMSGNRDMFKDGSCSFERVKIARMAITRDIEGAKYLPVPVEALAKSYLLKGNWREEWTYDVCGTVVPLSISFQSDGFGGARFQAETRR